MKLYYRDGKYWLNEASKSPPCAVKRELPAPKPVAGNLPGNALSVLLVETCDKLRLDVADVVGERRYLPLYRARQIISLIGRDDLKMSYERIGRMLRKDHTSIVNAAQAARQRVLSDVEFAFDRDVIRTRLFKRLAKQQAMVMEAAE